MKRINKKDLDRVKQIDLLTYFMNYYPDELTRSHRGEYRLKSNHSLVISNGMWNDFGQARTGGRTALDYLMKIEGLDFLTAAHSILELINNKVPETIKYTVKHNNVFRLPPRNSNDDQVIHYLTKNRKIDKELVKYCISKGLLYEDRYHNAVFLGYDYYHVVRYGFKRSTNSDSKLEVSGSQKEYSFKILNDNSSTIHVFEAAIDLLSFMTIEKMKHHDLNDNYISLGGTASIALEKYLDNNPTKKIILHLDNDEAGRIGTRQITELFKEKYEIMDRSPSHGKDFNIELLRLSKIQNDKSR